MSYPLINGATINGEEEGLLLQGLDLVVADTALMVEVMLPDGAEPLETGDVALEFHLDPDGLDLVATETHEAIYDAVITPVGIDMVVAGTAGTFVTYIVGSAYPLELGANRPQLGRDIVLIADSIELVREGLHSALTAMPAPDIAVTVGSARPLILGDLPAIERGTITLDATSAFPVELGTPGVTAVMLANSAQPMELGAPGTGQIAAAQSVQPLEMGAQPVLAFYGFAIGIDIGRQGRHSALRGPVEVFVDSAQPLEFGGTGLPAIALHARQSFPLQVGLPAADRGMTC
ncbi:MAG: hypothetical protein ACK4OE_04500 [Acidovorax sp.]|uniref:hypothetical protein n=1 Tax=Acidovorax sp. TaxID=1872122 RepID=UPI00391DB4C4